MPTTSLAKPPNWAITFRNEVLDDGQCFFYGEADDTRCPAPAEYIVWWNDKADRGSTSVCAVHTTWIRSAPNADWVARIETYDASA
jgi:hypothetical protein